MKYNTLRGINSEIAEISAARTGQCAGRKRK
jgi:hypothetical protein